MQPAGKKPDLQDVPVVDVPPDIKAAVQARATVSFVSTGANGYGSLSSIHITDSVTTGSKAQLETKLGPDQWRPV